MSSSPQTRQLPQVILFLGERRIARGPLAEAASQAAAQLEEQARSSLLVFDADSSRPIDIDWRGTPSEVAARLAGVHNQGDLVGVQNSALQNSAGEVVGVHNLVGVQNPLGVQNPGVQNPDVVGVHNKEGPAAQSAAPGRGRPRLGVVAREVTLLPRHWEWLAEQPGGASVTLRKLIDHARQHEGTDGRRRRRAQDSAYRFMTAMAGNAAGFEEALRALYAGDARAFARHSANWPEDIRSHARELAQPVFDQTASA
jgi:uncharacterized protein